MDSDRYTNKPVLLLLENYVLDCIGELDEQKQTTTAELVKKIFGGEKDWRKTIQDELGLAPSLIDQLQAMWVSGKEAARQQGAEISAREFAMVIVEENFAEMVEMITSDVK